MIAKIREALREAIRRARGRRDAYLDARENRNERQRQLERKLEAFNRVQKELKEDPDNKKLQEQAEELRQEIQHHRSLIETLGRRVRHRYERLKFWARKRSSLRKKLHQAIQQAQNQDPDWEPWMNNGNPTNITSDVKEVIAYAVTKFGLTVTSTTGGTHATNSWHYHGRAVDLAGPWQNMVNFQRFAAGKWPNALEIFGPDGFYVKNGVRYGGHFPGHGDHDHIAR